MGLPRRAYAGVRVARVGADAAVHGLRVEGVDGSGPFARAGVVVGDVLLSIDGEAAGDDGALKRAIHARRAGDALPLTAWRDGSARDVVVALDAWPVESHPDALVRLGCAERDGYRLRTLVVSPTGDGPWPAVFFLQGYSCGTIERPESYGPHDGVRGLVEALVKGGCAVWRVEKRGVDDSEGAPCDEQDLRDEHEDFAAAVEAALARSRGVVLFGHSLGGLHAPALATRFPGVRGVAVYGAGIHPWIDYLDVNGRRQMRAAGLSSEQVEALAGLRRRFFHAALVEGRPVREVFSRDAELDGVRAWLGVDERGRIAGRTDRYWREVNEAPVAEWFEALRVPVLSMWGTDDGVSERDEHAEIAAVIEGRQPGSGRFVEVEGADHAMLRDGAFDPHIATTLLEWMRSLG